MKVDNSRIINKLSSRTLKASKQRNHISILAIAMTTLLFTAMFTILFSLNSSYQSYSFRQIGGYSHGSFKDISEEQIVQISKNKAVKDFGIRTHIGIIQDGVFSKEPAEISYMDANTAKWSYINLAEGKHPESLDEIVLDTSTLKLLGIPQKLGSKIVLSFEINDRTQSGESITDEFTLVGYWENDELLPIHYINISKEYAEKIQNNQIEKGGRKLRSDMNVMLSSSINIEKQMNKILIEEYLDTIPMGVNWGYSSSRINSILGVETLVSIILFLIVVILTGYLIISNIFHISISSDIRFYGLLKTIGVTTKQLKRIVYKQVVLLCLWGIPIGLLFGYVVGSILTPFIIEKMGIAVKYTATKEYIIIIIMASLFSLLTVMFSCLKPAKYAGRVSPIEAVGWIEASTGISRKTNRKSKSVNALNMAIANMDRNRKKGILVIISITLSMVLFNVLGTFVTGFDMDKYLAKKSCADFIVSSPQYFSYMGGYKDEISDEIIEDINKNTNITLSGSGYSSTVYRLRAWVTEEQWKGINREFSPKEVSETIARTERKDGYLSNEIQIEGFDKSLIDEKINVIEGDLNSVFKNNCIALVLNIDNYGNPIRNESYPKVGEELVVEYIQEVESLDIRTGENVNESTPEEYIGLEIKESNTISYTVGAYITVPYVIGFRYRISDLNAVLPVEVLKTDSGRQVNRLYYLFDTSSKEDILHAEAFLEDRSSLSQEIMYESKLKLEIEFENFKKMFVITGSLLCFIIGAIGALNYINTLITSFIARKKEFAIMQAVGLTGKQLKKFLIFESGIYLITSLALSMTICIIISKPLNLFLERIFWFYEGKLTVIPLLTTVPILTLLGWLVPNLMYSKINRLSLIERIRE